MKKGIIFVLMLGLMLAISLNVHASQDYLTRTWTMGISASEGVITDDFRDGRNGLLLAYIGTTLYLEIQESAIDIIIEVINNETDEFVVIMDFYDGIWHEGAFSSSFSFNEVGSFTLSGIILFEDSLNDFSFNHEIDIIDNYIMVFPSSHSILLDGKSINLVAYNIMGNNFFRLRDIAGILSGTASQFEVKWNDPYIAVTTDAPYTFDGSESRRIDSWVRVQARRTSSMLQIDGQHVDMTIYNIDGWNFFKLRELSEVLGFDVDWDSETSTILITTH
ncbi:MAG: copper amine oxidase N-terminal domain-containing protein [Defluviitaleaceae bacterium]|nr:copper amine oxidase N-terminal domain-containing protein [Defluviitaleaceae bacterium]